MREEGAGGVKIEVLATGRARVSAVNPGARFDLPWDRYRQLEACAHAVRGILFAKPESTVLDAGGTDGALALFLPEYTVEVVKCGTEGGGMFDAESKGHDVVVATDVIEHLEPRRRAVFIAQMARACRLACVLNFPLPTSSTAQKIVASLTGDARIKDHIRFGLPYASTVWKHFEDMGFSCSSVQHTSRSLWATYQALQHCDGAAALTISRFLIEDAPDAPAGDCLYETVVARRNP